MKENNLSQLVGALGGWLQARPYGAEQDALDRAARIVLDMRLLGVDIDDVDAPELAALDPEDREVVDQARMWAQARREEARRRRVADERAARQRRVAERESGPNEAFAWPARPSTPPPPTAASAVPPDAGDVDAPPVPDPIHVASAAAEPAPVEAEFALEPTEQAAARAADETGSRETDSMPSVDSTELADPDDHIFFVFPEDAKRETDSGQVRSRRLRPEAVFRVVIVVWSLAALGVLVVLLRIALG